MKKLMFLVAMMCCMVPASAQQVNNKMFAHKSLKDKVQQVEKWNRYTNTFSEKLDSVYTNYEKAILAYDERFNCVKLDYYYNWNGWTHEYTEEYIYDEQDRITTLVMSDGEYKTKLEYTYNAEGWLSEELEYGLDGDEWILGNKYTYEYDVDGHMVLSVGYYYYEGWIAENKMTWEYEDGLLQSDVYYYYDEYLEDWVSELRNDYSYNEQGLCIETLQSDWEMENKYEYEYDEVGNLISATISSRYHEEEWTFDQKTEYSYDNNRNCIRSSYYYYNSELEDWDFYYETVFTYDLSTPISSIAGIFMIWDEELPIYNKVLGWESLIENETISIEPFYSSCMGLSETTENQLIIWPNPASETLNLNAKGLRHVEIFTMDGKQIMHTEKNFENVSVNALAKGCYLLKATFADGTKAIQKFVKE